MSDTLHSLLFENLTLLLLTEFAALAVVLAIHRRKFNERSRRAVWITLGFCAFLIFIQYWVKTDREKLKEATETLTTAVDHADLPTIADHLDKNFEDYQGHDKQIFLQQVEMVLQRWQVNEASIWQYNKVDIGQDTAIVEFQVFCDLRGEQFVQRNFPSRWRLQFIRRDDGWKVMGIKPLKYGPYEAERIDVLNY
jgi:hypothetical protein